MPGASRSRIACARKSSGRHSCSSSLSRATAKSNSGFEKRGRLAGLSLVKVDSAPAAVRATGVRAIMKKPGGNDAARGDAVMGANGSIVSRMSTSRSWSRTASASARSRVRSAGTKRRASKPSGNPASTRAALAVPRSFQRRTRLDSTTRLRGMKSLVGSAPTLPKTFSATAVGSSAARTANLAAVLWVAPPPVSMAT